LSARHRLIVGLDVPTVQEAERVVSTLGDSISFYKIGYQLAFAGGLEFARDLAREGKQVFLDMKLLDIDNTVASAVENIARMGMTMLTLHAYPKAMAAAVKAAEGSGLCLLGVTVLTSMDEQDLTDAGYEYDPHTLVLKRAEQARIAGMCGIVCSAEEASAVRGIVGPKLASVTPGIRPAGADKGDQKRACARPIVRAEDPNAAGLAIPDAMSAAMAKQAKPKTNREDVMAKGSWIARADIRDAERYKDYVAAAKPAFEKYGATFLARGGAHTQLEGQARSRNVVIEFPSHQAAVDCYNSPEYQIAAKIRQEVADAEMVVVEGV